MNKQIRGKDIIKFIELFDLQNAYNNSEGVVLGGICLSKDIGTEYDRDHFLFDDGRYLVQDYTVINHGDLEELEEVVIIDGSIFAT